MTKLSKISLAAFGGLAVLVLAGQADAAIDRTKFRASPDELRRYCCERIDQDFWRADRTYGCGHKIGCSRGKCRVYVIPPPPPPPNYPPPVFTHDADGHSDADKTGVGTGGGGNSGGKGGSSAAGAN